MSGNLKALRLINHILGGALGATDLEGELANSSTYGAFRAAMAQRGAVRAILNSPTACDILIGSPTGAGAIAWGDALEELAGSTVGLAKLHRLNSVASVLMGSPAVGKALNRLRMADGLYSSADLDGVEQLSVIASNATLMNLVAASPSALNAFLQSAAWVGQGIDTLRVAQGETTAAALTGAASMTNVLASYGANTSYLINLAGMGERLASCPVFVSRLLDNSTTQNALFSATVTANLGLALDTHQVDNGGVSNATLRGRATVSDLTNSGTALQAATSITATRERVLSSSNFASSTVTNYAVAVPYLAGSAANAATREAVWGSDVMLNAWNSNVNVATQMRSGLSLRSESLGTGTFELTTHTANKEIWISASRSPGVSINLAGGKRAGSGVGSSTLATSTAATTGTTTTNVFATEGPVSVQTGGATTLYYYARAVGA